MKLTFGRVAVLSCLVMNLFAADTFPLWEKEVPGSLGSAEKDIPTLTVFRAEEGKATGAAMVICPGGGYGGLAQHEGKDYAEWLAKNGVTSFVLKYRLGSAGYRHPVMLGDAARAVRLVRARASEWGVDTKRIGIMGSSAGGHLASTLLTHFDEGQKQSSDAVEKQSSRPDLGILCYAVISMGEYTHGGSKKNLLGDSPSEDLVKLLSNELQVTTNTPPTFLWHTYEDSAVVPQNSMLFALALQKNKVPYELHIYEKGRHGIGLANGHPWTEQCLRWLQLRGFVKE
ncbi:MAG TPA: alpha/beta hydrolase [Candidatus Kapabacteria bacterium]|nr:alpha/beta hydrolase [Candidatus Kapabacteria bacterium]